LQIDLNAPVRASAEIEIGADPEVVWDVLATIQEWPKWNPDVKSVSVSGAVTAGTSFRWKSGPGTITSTLQQVDRPHVLGWTGKTLGITAIHVWRVEGQDGHSVVSSNESWDGFVVRVCRRQLQKVLEKAVETGPLHLKAEAERRSKE
jgi:Polyketide cyclase / dehydrase and lipid transport